MNASLESGNELTAITSPRQTRYWIRWYDDKGKSGTVKGIDGKTRHFQFSFNAHEYATKHLPYPITSYSIHSK